MATAVLAGLLVLALVHPVWAGGYELGTDQGGEALARAGAATAYSNPMALYTNVAGIADIPRYMIFLTDSLSFRRVRFTRTPEPEVRSLFNPDVILVPQHAYDPVEDQTAVYPIGVGLAAHIRLNDYFVLSLGAHGPTSVGWANFEGPNFVADAERDGDGNWVNNLSAGGRADLTHMDVVLLWPTIALGLTVPGVENLRIGLGFQPGFVHMVFRTFAEAYSLCENGCEIEAELSLWDPFIPAGEIGLLYRAWRFDMGFNLRISDSVLASGDSEGVTATVHYVGDDASSGHEAGDTTAASATGATFESPWPLAVLRLGLRYAHPRAGVADDARMPWQRELFDVELDFVYENTSIVDEFTVALEGMEVLGVGPVDKTLSVRHDWRDNFSIRLGGSVHLLGGMLTLSAGVSWESGAVPEDFTRLDYLSWMRVGLAVGATFRISVVEISLAYQHIFMPGRTVDPLPEGTPDESICEQRACMLSAVAEFGPGPINTGEYEASYDILGISLAFRWGEGSGAQRAQAAEPEADEEPPMAEPEETAPPMAEPEPVETSAESAAAEGDAAFAATDAEESSIGGQTAPPSGEMAETPEEEGTE